MSATNRQKIYPVKMRRVCAFIIDICVAFGIAYLLFANFRFPDMETAWQYIQVLPTAAPAEQNVMLLFLDKVYFQILVIWLVYEVITQLIFKGATLGKLAMRISVVPINPQRSKRAHYMLMTVRTFLKMLLIYIWSGIPFLVSVLIIFRTSECQSGYDIVVRSTIRCNEESAQQVKQKFAAKKAKARA